MTPPTDNPWKKRRQGPQEFMPPSRALFAERAEDKATATWARWPHGGWKCVSASGILGWMRGSIDPQSMPGRLRAQGVTWHWIEPNTVRVLAPPF